MNDPDVPPPLPSEQLLIDHCDRDGFRSALVITPGRGQSAVHLKSICPSGDVACWSVDAFRGDRIERYLCEVGADIAVLCGPDLPEDQYDRVFIAVLMRGEAEMTRELLQQAHQRLEIGGQLIASVNNPNDRWLREQMQALFDKVHCRSEAAGWVYRATKQKPLKKVRRFEAEFTFREGERHVRVITRPSVFSHRSLDDAARVLINHSDVGPGDRVLDMGCGSGAVAISAAIRSQTGDVLAVDCNHRAVECVRRTAQINDVFNLRAIVNHDGRFPEGAVFDVSLLNPPYYGQFAIAEHFMRAATAVTRVGGRVLVVTKQAELYHATAWTSLWLTAEAEHAGYQLLTYERHGSF